MSLSTITFVSNDDAEFQIFINSFVKNSSYLNARDPQVRSAVFTLMTKASEMKVLKSAKPTSTLVEATSSRFLEQINERNTSQRKLNMPLESPVETQLEKLFNEDFEVDMTAEEIVEFALQDEWWTFAGDAGKLEILDEDLDTIVASREAYLEEKKIVRKSFDNLRPVVC
jgi:hypothetical protein